MQDNKGKIIDFANLSLANLQNSLKSLNFVIDENFYEIVKELSETKGRIIFCSVGKSYWISKKISTTISSLGKQSFCLHAGEASHGDLGVISNDDKIIFISNSGNTREILPVVEYCKNKQIKTFCITANKASFLACNCDKAIVLPKFTECFEPINPPTTSALLTLAIGDLLAISIAKITNFTLQNYGTLHPGGNIGLLSTTLLDFISKRKSKQGVTYSSVKIENNASFQDGISNLNKHNLGIIVITDKDGKLLSCFSDGDLKRLFVNLLSNGQDISQIASRPFIDYCIKNPRSMSVNASLYEALQIIKANNISHVLLVDDKNVFIDILDKKDVIAWL